MVLKVSSNISDSDDDLNDLLGTESPQMNNSSSSERVPLNIDRLEEELDNNDRYYYGSQAHQPSCNELCFAYCSYTCTYAPKCCLLLGLLALAAPAYFLVTAWTNPTEHFGEILNDYTEITSKYDLQIGKVDHWCLKGDDTSCRCEDPLQPQPRGEFRQWTKAHDANVKDIQHVVETGTEIDIAFLGESVVEEMDGRWFGEKTGGSLSKLDDLFAKNFKKASGAKLEGLALGVAGDTNASVLWRLMNGEMPAAFNPKIWWIQLGLNDLGRMQCSEEIVELGILRVVEEILERKPKAKVVINSLLPMANLRGGLMPGKTAYMDSFQQAKGRMPASHYAQRPNRPARPSLTGDEGGNRRNLGEGMRKSNVRGEPSAEQGGLISGQHRELFGLFKHHSKTKDVQMRDHQFVQKKYRPIVHKERKLPLWTSITAINDQLKKFCAKHDRVTFFDATDIFAEKEEADVWTLNSSTITLRGHPTEAGYRQWEEAIVKRALGMLKEPSTTTP